MRTTAIAIALSLLTVGTASSSPLPDDEFPAASRLLQYSGGVRIWASNDRDYFRRGDRLRVNFSTRMNAYVAVVHVDPDGYLDFVYPRSPWDTEYVRAGRTYNLSGTGWANGLTLRGQGGIGYLYIVASAAPLDYSRFRAGRGSAWDWSYAGRRVSGDPFFAMEQITRMLVPRWNSAPFDVDYYTYFLDGPQRYPSYACGSRSLNDGWGWGYYAGWNSYYGSCDRLNLFLRDNPYYFNTRRLSVDRRGYYRNYTDWDPRHGFKADPQQDQSRPIARPRTPATSSVTPTPPRNATPDRRDAATTQPEAKAAPQRAPAAQPAPRASERPPASATPAPRRAEPAARAPDRADPAPARTPAARPVAPPSRQGGTAAPAARRPEPAARPQAAPRNAAPAPASRAAPPREARPATPASRRGGN